MIFNKYNKIKTITEIEFLGKESGTKIKMENVAQF